MIKFTFYYVFCMHFLNFSLYGNKLKWVAQVDYIILIIQLTYQRTTAKNPMIGSDIIATLQIYKCNQIATFLLATCYYMTFHSFIQWASIIFALPQIYILSLCWMNIHLYFGQGECNVNDLPIYFIQTFQIGMFFDIRIKRRICLQGYVCDTFFFQIYYVPVVLLTVTISSKRILLFCSIK